MRQHFEEIDSTSNWLQHHIGEYQHGFVVDADFQTAGKGQATNKWESARGENLLFSMLLEPTKIAIQEQFILSEIVSLAMIDTLREVLPCDVRIKWPNDIYVGDCKLSGILIETIVSGNNMRKAILGIGLNVNQTTFVSDAPNPISMKNITGKSYDREQLLQQLTTRIKAYYESYKETDAKNIQKRYFSALYRNEGYHTYARKDGTKLVAKIVDVKPTGHLVLCDEADKEHLFAFKEVAFVI